MNKDSHNLESLLMFDEQLPAGFENAGFQFRSECKPDRVFKSDNLFKFRRGRGDFHASIAAALLALAFLLFFWTETGWQDRKLPENLGNYIGYQLGLTDIDGRAQRLGTILKQSWVVPLVCLLVLVPASLFNLKDSWQVRRWRQRFLLSVDARYETAKYVAALEYVVYFMIYTLSVPWIGYLVSTLVLGVFLTWRLGYRTLRWAGIALLSSFAVVLVFRSLLQIKTPVSIWLYDQFPTAFRSFMLTYF